MKKAVQILAIVVSYLFHPLFMLFYTLFLLICLKPQLFGVLIWSEQMTLLLMILIYSAVIPGISIALMRMTGLIKSLNMENRFERIGPLIICAIFNLWLWINLKSQENIPKLFTAFVLASIICIFISFVINTGIKISLHAVGMASFCTMWILVRFYHSEDGIFYFRFVKESLSGFHLHGLIALSFILAGCIGTCRLYLKAHELHEIHLGFFVGIFSTILAFSYTF